jgi:hypothetical protein
MNNFSPNLQSDSKEFFCESRQQYQFNDFIPQYIVQLGTRKICVIWSADTTHCGVDGEKLLSPWYVSEATGTKTQFAYRAIFSPQEVQFVITRNEVFNTSKAAEELSQTSQTSFKFHKEKSELISSIDVGFPQQIKYVCSVWQKKPWWKIF